MQRPWNCNIYTERPPANQRAARQAWDFFLVGESRQPVRMWFTRDTPPWSCWVMEWPGEEYEEALSCEVREWAASQKAYPHAE